MCIQLVYKCHSVLWYCKRCFSSYSTSIWHTKGTLRFLRLCSFWLLYCNFPAFVFLVHGVRSILSTVYWEREHRHDLHDVAVTSGHASPNLGMVLHPLWCLEMAWGHSSWSSVNLSFPLTVCTAKYVSLGSTAKQMQVAEVKWLGNFKALYDDITSGFFFFFIKHLLMPCSVWPYSTTARPSFLNYKFYLNNPLIAVYWQKVIGSKGVVGYELIIPFYSYVTKHKSVNSVQKILNKQQDISSVPFKKCSVATKEVKVQSLNIDLQRSYKKHPYLP